MIILVGESAYQNLTDIASKRIVMAALMSTVSIGALLLINDLIEADKVGPFFFLNACIVTLNQLKSKKDKAL